MILWLYLRIFLILYRWELVLSNADCTLFNKCHRLQIKLRWYCILDYYDHFWMDYKMLRAGLTLHIYINMHQLNISLTLHGVSTLFLYGNLSKLTLFAGRWQIWGAKPIARTFCSGRERHTKEMETGNCAHRKQLRKRSLRLVGSVV